VWRLVHRVWLWFLWDPYPLLDGPRRPGVTGPGTGERYGRGREAEQGTNQKDIPESGRPLA
jgi:hypothetical protein